MGEGTARGGFTLIEVILALALSTLLLAAMMLAIHTHLRVVEKGRMNVEEAQLARALLHRIANDLRGAVRYDPLDITKLVPELGQESLDKLAKDSGFEDMDLSDTSKTGTAQTASKTGTTKSSSDSETTQAPSDSAAPQLVPGLYGNRYELQVDVSRLPRIDQFERALVPAGSTLSDRASDVKTVAYYVVQPQTGAVTHAAGDAANRHGLVRRELDRAVTSWAADRGDLEQQTLELEPIAPEVMAIEFLYFDGQQWLEEWDSDAMRGLPVAVQIGIAIEPASQRGLPAQDRSYPQEGSTGANARPIFYRLLVHLPASAPMTDSTADESDDDSEDQTTDESGDTASEDTKTGDQASQKSGRVGDTSGDSSGGAMPGGSPATPGSFNPDALSAGSIDPSAFRGRSFNPEMLRGRSFNPDMFQGRQIDPAAIRDRLQQMGISPRQGGSFPGRSFGGGRGGGRSGGRSGGRAGGGAGGRSGGGFGGRSGGGPGGGSGGSTGGGFSDGTGGR